MLKSLAECGPDPRPLTKAEGQALSDLAKRLPPNPIIVQIGAYFGVSTAVMLETRPDAFIFSIDIKPCEQERVLLIDLGLDYRRVVRVLGDSAEVGAFWPHYCNLLLIDGDHTYEGCKADCEAWLPSVKDYVVFHDYIIAHPPEKNQVFVVVEEFFHNYDYVVRAGSLIGFEIWSRRD